MSNKATIDKIAAARQKAAKKTSGKLTTIALME
jgi:hypothetical protein